MRVLQGIIGQAGQPYAISRGLRSVGIHSDVLVTRKHKFDYPYDLFFPSLADLSSLEDLTRVIEVIKDYDVLHFHARSFLYSPKKHMYPSALDLLVLRLMGKKIVFHYRGSELRPKGKFREVNPFHYADDESCSNIFSKISDEGKEALIPFVQAVAHKVLVTDPELQTYAPDATIVPRTLIGSEWPFVGVCNETKPLVVHAPSRRGVKGSEFILKACEELKSEGLEFRFRLIENMSHEEAMAVYRQADIIVDQLRVGWYGVLSVEAMALGKLVVAYIRDDLWNQERVPIPILNANPSNIKKVLKHAIQDGNLRAEMGKKAREYFERVHDAEVVGGRLRSIYEDISSSNQCFDAQALAIGSFLDYQHKKQINLVKKLSKGIEYTSAYDIELSTLPPAVRNLVLVVKAFQMGGVGEVSRGIKNRIRVALSKGRVKRDG